MSEAFFTNAVLSNLTIFSLKSRALGAFLFAGFTGFFILLARYFTLFLLGHTGREKFFLEEYEGISISFPSLSKEISLW